MIREADAIVIGSGGFGASTAFHLARRGVTRVVLVERHEIGSQTSPRAAGMVSHVRGSDLLSRLVILASAGIRGFAETTGQRLDRVHSGSLKIARRVADADVLERDLTRARDLGLDVEMIPPDEARRLHPFVHAEGIEAILRIGDDMYFEPAQVAVGFAKGAQALGATLLPNTSVTRVVVESGVVRGVEAGGVRIDAPVVVDAGGAWARQIAEASGIHVPLLPVRHQLFVTEPIEGAHATLPMVRIMDASVYVRPCQGGFMWGGYEEDPLWIDMSEMDAGFQIADTPLDRDVLLRLGKDVEPQFPILARAEVREHRGGIPTMTADGMHLVGPLPEAAGFFVASGCNVAGLSVSPAIGDLLAERITTGTSSLDLTPFSIERFRAEPVSGERFRRSAAWQYRHFYGSA